MKRVKVPASFEDAVRALARREGFEVADDEIVRHEFSGGQQGCETCGNSYGNFSISCGRFYKQYGETWSSNNGSLEDFWNDILGPTDHGKKK